jgi:proteasome lid subunit RPN8/RPN11
MTGLFLPQGILDAMIAHAETAAPVEACGMLSGQERIVREIHALPGADGSEGGLRALSTQYLSVESGAREAGLEVLARYHCHPVSPAHPSADEIHLSFAPNAVCLVLSLLERWRPVLRGFRIHEGRVVEVPVQVFNDQDYDAAQDYVI